MDKRYAQGFLIAAALSLLAGSGWAQTSIIARAHPAATSGTGEKEEAPGTQRQELAQRARSLALVGKFDEALPLAQGLLDQAEKRFGPDDPRVARSLQGVANIYMGLRKFRSAIPLYQRALKIREKVQGPDHPETAESLVRLGKVYIEVGDFAQALPLVERSLEIRKRVLGLEHADTAESLATLAELRRQTGALDQALSLAQQSLAIREKALGGAHPGTAGSLILLAMIYQQQGQAEKALPLAEKAVQIDESALGPDHPLTAQAQRTLGLIHKERKDYSKAESAMEKGQHKGLMVGVMGKVEVLVTQGSYQQALDLLSAHSAPPWMGSQNQALYYTQKGLALQGLGRLSEAAVAFGEAIRSIEALRARTPGERTGFFQGGRISGHYKTYQALTGVLVQMAQTKQPLPDELKGYGADPAAAAFYVAESIKGRSLLEAIAAKAGTASISQLPPDLASREKKLQDDLATLEASQEKTFQPHFGMKSDAAALQEQIKTAQERQREFLEVVRRQAPRYAALNYPRPYKTTELPLKPGEVMLAYTLGEKGSFLFRVEPGGRTQVFPLAFGQGALEKKIAPLLAPLRQAELRREDLDRFGIPAAATLYQELLAPALSGVAPGARLIIVPDGVLGAFPFEALVVQAGPNWGKSVLVADRWPITYVQSAAILTLNRLLGASKASQPLFALGDCIYEQASPRYQGYKAGQGQAGALKHLGAEKALTMSATGVGGGRLQFPPLPQTRQTVTELATLFQVKQQPPQVLLDVQATETWLSRTPLGQFRYLFFGTHGFLADNLAGIQEPTLVLSQVENQPPDNGFLTFHKVLQLNLDADLVALAACMTGVGQVTKGEGVLNFARAFQQAGARSVMVALWNIPVEESMKFYQTFYKALKDGKPKLEALKMARQAVRSKEPHPYFWAGLILHGEG
jgi:CHAT domain-containing protein/Tfp pilus assembly protein PilF